MWKNATKIGCGYCTNVSSNYNYVTCRYKHHSEYQDITEFDKNTSTIEWESYPTPEDAYAYTYTYTYTQTVENSTNEEILDQDPTNVTVSYSIEQTSVEILLFSPRAPSYHYFFIKTLVKVLISVTALVGVFVNVLVVCYVVLFIYLL